MNWAAHSGWAGASNEVSTGGLKAAAKALLNPNCIITIIHIPQE